MHCLRFDGSFAGWRQLARQALLQGLAPHQVQWLDKDAAPGLFDQYDDPVALPSGRLRVSPELLAWLESAASYRGEGRWSLLYRVLWRFVKGERYAVLAGDPDGSELQRRIKAVRREIHHMHAFLRFRRGPSGSVDFVAWFEPAHDILPAASQLFCDRLGRHSWLIATPRDGVRWDGQQLQHEPACPAQWRQWAQQPEEDDQTLWLTYYSSIFNPARLNPLALQQHLPVRFWKHLPEGPLIPQLISDARAGAQSDGQATLLTGRKGKQIAAKAAGKLARTGSDGISGTSVPDLPQ